MTRPHAPGGDRGTGTGTSAATYHRWRPSVLAGVLVLATLGTGARPVEASTHTLMNGNATVVIDPNTSNGVYAWIVDSVPQLTQQWYWLRVGSGPEVPLSSLGLQVESSPFTNQLRLDYAGTVGAVILQITLTYTLVGGSPGSHESQIYEQMAISAPLERSDVVVNLFRYTDLDLAGTSAGDQADWLPPDTIRQFKGQLFAEAVAAPAPSHFAIGIFPSILSLLSDAGPTTLADSPASLGPGNITFAVEWDLPLPTRTTATANHTMGIGPAADLSITKTDGQVTAVPGNPVAYTITVTNGGPNPVTGATVTDTFPTALGGVTWTCAASAGSSCGAATGSGNISQALNLVSAGTATFLATGTLNPTATGTLWNTATVATPGGITDPNPANNSATDTDAIVPSADLSITKTDGQSTAVPGTPVTYTIVASNAGPNPVAGATVVDAVPAAITGATWTCVGAGGGTCAPSGSGNINDTVDLQVGASVTYILTGTINPAARWSLSNTGTVAAPAGVTDPNPANNSATDSDVLPGVPGVNYFTLAPCRVVDTRGGAPIGGPVLQGQETRVFTLAGNCSIPMSAKALSVNLTATESTAAGNIRLFPAGEAVPTASSINYAVGQIRANNAIVSLDLSGQLAAFVGQPAGSTVHLIIDVNGYFE